MDAETLPVIMSIANYDTLIPFYDEKAFSFLITNMKVERIADNNGVLQPKITVDYY
jgi:hypothetical protein